MRKEFEFETAQELIDCLEKNKKCWQGQKVTAFYRDTLLSSWTDGCFAFLMEEYTLVLNYHFMSFLYGEFLHTKTFLADIQNGEFEKYGWYELAPKNNLFFVG
ncbi:MAG: hypothetical protein IJN89_03385, partial [Anaerotignum sp.]|nr:hypothetical protein [Anaerotignum sp.]